MVEKIQKILAASGKSGCYALCLIQAARPEILPGAALDFIISAVAQGYIYLNVDNPSDGENMRVDYAAELVCLTRGDPIGTWKRRRELPGYKNRPGELVIERWVSGDKQHFIVREDSRAWDPYGNSETVRTGRLESFRIISRAA